MTSRPFNTSTKKPASVKLRGLQTSKAVTQQLEVDSRRMEERLRELKVAMNREKEERESRGNSNTGIWASGKPGALTTHANEVMKKKSLAPPGQTAKPKSGTKGRKIKVLKDSPIEVPQRPKFKFGTSGGDSTSHRGFKGPACGQCEQKAVALTCMECGENYCTGCYARFHMKGALKNHRSVPYQSPTSSSESLPVAYENGLSDPRNVAPKPPISGRKSTTGVDGHSPNQEKVVRVVVKSPAPTSTGGALLEGDYDEQESAAAFAAALAEWRQSKRAEGTAQVAPGTPRGTSTATTTEGTSTSNGDISPRQIEIKFKENSSLSYADRLLLKKHRRTELSEAPSPDLVVSGLSKETKQQENVLKKERKEVKQKDGRDSEPLVNGDINFVDDEELEDEHQRYVNIFSKRISPETSYSDPRSESVLAISEVTEGDDDNLETASAYSVQEGPDNEPVIEQTNESGTQLSRSQSKPKSTKSTTPPSVQGKEKSSRRKPSGSSSSRKTSADSPKTPAAPLQKSKEERPSSKSRAQSRSASTKPKVPQSAGKSKGQTARSSATVRPKSKASAVKDKADEAKCNTPTQSVPPERPVSVGLTTRPSEGLMQASQHAQQPQHQYKEGLSEFFTAGLTGEERPKSRDQSNRSSSRSSVTPTNELPECTFQGSSVWRPESSLTTPDEALQQPYSPSPPSRAFSRPSSGKRPTRQVKTPVKQIARNPETGSPIPENGNACVVSDNRPTGGAMGGTNVGMVLREASSRASQRGQPDRCSSRIEVDGEDMTMYDEDVALTHRETSADDRETLEQLTWELASQEGRITADGRITSMSVLEDDNEDQTLDRFSHDAELGILQDDGHGSGLSTPCEVVMERDELSEEDLQADFEENEHCKGEVEALR